VCVGIIPWNFPLLMAVWKITMATATGNTIVLKPSPETPLSALVLAELVTRTRIPRGVINVVVAPGRRVGELLTQHPKVDRIAFTGSTPTGKAVLKAAADTMKRVSLELGGKSANIVLPDADMDTAVDGALFASMLHSGQVCESGTRLLLHDSIYAARRSSRWATSSTRARAWGRSSARSIASASRGTSRQARRRARGSSSAESARRCPDSTTATTSRRRSSRTSTTR
jgi:acyl-CoA reductase-like NAD-dependent aldehyde dehydrogenase